MAKMAFIFSLFTTTFEKVMMQYLWDRQNSRRRRAFTDAYYISGVVARALICAMSLHKLSTCAMFDLKSLSQQTELAYS